VPGNGPVPGSEQTLDVVPVCAVLRPRRPLVRTCPYPSTYGYLAAHQALRAQVWDHTECDVPGVGPAATTRNDMAVPTAPRGETTYHKQFPFACARVRITTGPHTVSALFFRVSEPSVHCGARSPWAPGVLGNTGRLRADSWRGVYCHTSTSFYALRYDSIYSYGIGQRPRSDWPSSGWCGGVCLCAYGEGQHSRRGMEIAEMNGALGCFHRRGGGGPWICVASAHCTAWRIPLRDSLLRPAEALPWLHGTIDAVRSRTRRAGGERREEREREVRGGGESSRASALELDARRLHSIRGCHVCRSRGEGTICTPNTFSEHAVPPCCSSP
jgi:hypothetical protein